MEADTQKATTGVQPKEAAKPKTQDDDQKMEDETVAKQDGEANKVPEVEAEKDVPVEEEKEVDKEEE